MFGKIRKVWGPFNKSTNPEQPNPKSTEQVQDISPVIIKGLIKPKIISYYADYEERKYYEGFAKILIEKCNLFGLDYDISEIESRENYGANCLMKPEFILEKLKLYKKPLIWMDCDTDFREPFGHFNEVTEDIGMATHSGELDGIKASPLYFNYTKGSFKILREWVVHCRACYDNRIVELDHDALKHHVLDATRGSYSAYLLTDNWNDFVHGRYIWNGNSRVEGKIQAHRKVAVSDDTRRAYSQDVKFIKVIFESEDLDPIVFKSALNFLDRSSNKFRMDFIFSEKILEESSDNDDLNRLVIESGGSVYFNPTNFDSLFAGKIEIIIGVNGVDDIEKDWDSKINIELSLDKNPLNNLNFSGGDGRGIRIKTNKKSWA